jgi:hypothetical protein
MAVARLEQFRGHASGRPDFADWLKEAIGLLEELGEIPMTWNGVSPRPAGPSASRNGQ